MKAIFYKTFGPPEVFLQEEIADPFPFERCVMGIEFAGEIEQVATCVKQFQPGDQVYGFRGFGTSCYASYKCMSEKGSLALKPTNLSYEEAAASVDGATTALFFLQEIGHLQKGQKYYRVQYKTHMALLVDPFLQQSKSKIGHVHRQNRKPESRETTYRNRHHRAHYRPSIYQ